MFCIWADYPGAETEASVISKTADTIAAFGATLPKIDDNKTVSDEATGVSVTAPGLTGITVAAVIRARNWMARRSPVLGTSN